MKRPVIKHPTPGEGDRLFGELRARYEGSIIADPAILSQPPSIHLMEALNSMGRISEATLADAPALIKKFGQELAVHALHVIRSADRQEDEE